MKRKTFVLGVDPGFSGAIAITDGFDLDIIDMPLKTVYGRKEIDARTLNNHIAMFAPVVKIAIIEDVHVMTGSEGVVSMFRFGYGAGIVEGVLTANNLGVVKIKPAVWKVSAGLNRDKETSIRRACEVFPRHASKYFTMKKHDGRAEAALIALTLVKSWI